MTDKNTKIEVPALKIEKPTGKPLPPPFPVSPVIKFFRWSLLITGIFYGASRHKRLARKEIIIREEEKKKKAIRDAELAEYRRETSERDIEMLAKILK